MNVSRSKAQKSAHTHKYQTKFNYKTVCNLINLFYYFVFICNIICNITYTDIICNHIKVQIFE